MKKFLLAVVLVCSVACNQQVAPPKPQITYFAHEVSHSGETLALIAKWYTGAASNWTQILQYNPGLDVRKIRKGTVIQIPETMLVRRDPLPQKIVLTANEKAESEKSKSAAAVAAVVKEPTSAVPAETVKESPPAEVQKAEDPQVAAKEAAAAQKSADEEAQKAAAAVQARAEESVKQAEEMQANADKMKAASDAEAEAAKKKADELNAQAQQMQKELEAKAKELDEQAKKTAEQAQANAASQTVAAKSAKTDSDATAAAVGHEKSREQLLKELLDE